MLKPTDPAAIAELQFKNASTKDLPAARRALIAAHKLTVKALDRNNPNSNIPDESWTAEEVEAANQILRNRNLGTIIKEDTAMWDLLTHTSQKIMVFYATPACHWIPAIVKAAALRTKGIEEKLGKGGGEEAVRAAVCGDSHWAFGDYVHDGAGVGEGFAAGWVGVGARVGGGEGVGSC
ncbi:uncharacterized protein AB675_6831 [Cyphellophora attinorum]|uniref:Uncharacterized protein n=1 Tax=Cyphellophora attinorum TaxID=1664694 RepID=A0A0N1P391_9EURO|nr:uncharacterized protein AB675_6831 [Phialophora attinorum]KPI43596.1 hypothetical protein AB675_6831 [Phialophora attinorum]